jgi:hypothetical protein
LLGASFLIIKSLQLSAVAISQKKIFAFAKICISLAES